MLVASALAGLAASPRTPRQATALFTRLFTDADATAEAYEAHGVSAASPSASLTPQDPMDHSSCSSNLKHCPNIMMLLSDDHGYTDLGKEIDPNVDTPNLDRMVREGLRFTSGYSSAPQCVPSRAGLMSGRDQNRFGLFQNGADAGHGEDTLPPNVKTIAEHVRKRGYVTGMAGKWHLGSNHDNKTNPGGRGFDEYMSGTMGNFYTNVDRSTGDVIHGAPLFDDAGTAKSSHVPNEELDSLKGLPKLDAQYRNRVDATGDFAEAFITRHAQRPFFFVRAGRLEPPPRTAQQGPPSLGRLAPRSEVPSGVAVPCALTATPPCFAPG
jgi:arylsulfatase A-like enzyme